MKTLKLFALSGFFAIAGCHDDNDNNDYMPTYYPPVSENIDGEWQLISVSGGIMGIDDDFTPNEVTWVFNENDQTVTITNNNTDENKIDLFDSGTYNYEEVTNEATPELCGINFKIDSTNLGCFTITENEFTISMVETDGYMIVLKRPQFVPF